MSHLLAHWVTCLSVLLNVINVLWNLRQGNWGLCVYWASAALITISAVWLRNWGS